MGTPTARFVMFVWLAAGLGMGCSTPGPRGQATPMATATPVREFSAIQQDEIERLQVTPLCGFSSDLAPLLGDRLSSQAGSYVPLLQQSSPDNVLIGFLGGVPPAQLDLRTSESLLVQGRLRTFEDEELVKKLEDKLLGKLFRRNGKAVWLEMTSDPWNLPTPSPTPTPRSGEPS